MSMTLIGTASVPAGSGQFSLDFMSIPQTFTDLVMVVSIRNTVNNSDATLYMNGFDTLTSMRILDGNGSTASSTNLSSTDAFPVVPSTHTSNTYGNSVFYFPNYTSSGNKSFSLDGVAENNATTAVQRLGAGLYTGAAITSMGMYCLGGGNIAQFSSASLYGILKGSGGATVS